MWVKKHDGYEGEFGRNLRNHRKRKKMTQGNLAELMGVSQGTISNWESASKTISLYDAIRLAEIFGLDILNIK